MNKSSFTLRDRLFSFAIWETLIWNNFIFAAFYTIYQSSLLKYIKDPQWKAFMQRYNPYLIELEMMLNQLDRQGVTVYPPRPLIFNALNLTPLKKVIFNDVHMFISIDFMYMMKIFYLTSFVALNNDVTAILRRSTPNIIRIERVQLLDD